MKYLRVNVLHTLGYPDSTNNGVSVTQTNNLVIECAEGNYTESEVKEFGLVVLVVKSHNGRMRATPVSFNACMFGGNFIWSSDSRFAKMYDHPIKIFDRIEN